MKTDGRMMIPVVAMAIGVFAACDPCFGVENCSTDPTISYSGRMVARATGAPVPGVMLELELPSEAGVADNRIVSTSDKDGFFRLHAPAAAAGNFVGSLTVRPPGNLPAYTVPGLPVRTTTRGGDGETVGRLVVDPYIAIVGEVRGRLSNGPAGGATVTFRRTGGLEIDGPVPQFVTAEDGRFVFAPRTTGFGSLSGEFVISAPGYPRSYTLPVSFSTAYKDTVISQVRVLRLGAALFYVADVYQRGSFARRAGVQVEFRRTGGIAIEPAVVTSTSNSIGLAPIMPTPLAEGEVIGDVTIRPPAPARPEVIRGVRLRTRDDDSVRLAGFWGYGAQFHYQVEFLDRATERKLDSGIVAVFRRRGGIQTSPDSQVVSVNQFGRIGLQLEAADTGTVSGDIEIRFRAPGRPDTVRITGSARADELQPFLGVHRVGRWLPWVARVREEGTEEPIVGARVEFRRTGGVPVQSDLFTTTSQEGGIFPVRPIPLADGEVVGDLFIALPAPFGDTLITGLRLPTTMDDSVRLISIWRFRRR